MNNFFSTLKIWLIRRRWLIRLATTYLLISVVLTALLVFFISRVVSTRIVNTTDANNRQLLSQVNLTLDYTLADLYSEFVHLWRKDPNIQELLNAAGDPNQLTIALDQLITSRLKYAVSQADLVDSAFLISHSYDRVWSSVGMPTTVELIQDKDALTFIQTYENNLTDLESNLFFSRQTQMSIDQMVQNKAVLSFLFIRRDPDNKLSEILLVNLDRQKIENLIFDHLDTGVLTLVSPSGDMIAQTKHEQIFGNLTDILVHPQTVTAILSSGTPNGSVIAETIFGKSLITWQEADKMGFLIIDFVPMSGLYQEANTVNRLIGSYFLITLLISLIAGIFAVRYLYQPIQTLVKHYGLGQSKQHSLHQDEFAILESAYLRFELQARDRVFAELLNGKLSQEAQALYPEAVQTWVAVAIMPTYASSFLPAVIERILQTFRSGLGSPVLLRSEDSIVALVGLTVEQAETRYRSIEQLKLHMIDLLGHLSGSQQLELIAGIGSCITQLSDSRTSLRQAIVAVNQAQLLNQKRTDNDQTDKVNQRVVLYDELGLYSPNHVTISTPNQAAAYIQKNLADSNLNLEAVAREIGISSGYLRQLFKQETGQTLNDYLIDERIKRACVMLEETDLTARDIAFAVGIQDSRYFYTVFKKKTGQTTEAYRRNLRGKRV
ncbi:MAG: AraC family transcriptional regulator [Eubacteriales bacterium]|nr:AraC family transcriptional regulator [Eubacteriales bacterium]